MINGQKVRVKKHSKVWTKKEKADFAIGSIAYICNAGFMYCDIHSENEETFARCIPETDLEVIK